MVDAGIGFRFPKRRGFFSVGVTNLFDEEFDYYDTDVKNPIIQPGRQAFCKITLALP